RIGLQLLIQLEQFRVGRYLALPVQPLQKVPAPFGQIDGARRQRLGMKGEPISARDRRASAVETPGQSPRPPAIRCVRARAPPTVRPVSAPSRATAPL